MAFVKSYLSWAHAVVGNHRAAACLARDVRDIGCRHGFAIWQVTGEIHLALAEYRTDGRADAAEVVERNAPIWEQCGGRPFLSYALTAAADIQASMGRHAVALAGFAKAGQFVADTGVCFYEAERLRLLARVQHSLDEDPLATLRQAWELAHRQGVLLFELRAALDFTRLAPDPAWLARLSAAVQRFLPGAGYPELHEARALLAGSSRRP